MRSTRTIRQFGVGFLFAGALGCSDPNAPDVWGASTMVLVHHDEGGAFGTDLNHSYSQSTAIITVVAAGPQLNVEVEGDERWSGVFRIPTNVDRLERGSYTNLQRFRIQAREAGGLHWAGRDVFCDALTGSFTIDRVVYDGDILKAIDLRFEEHCEGEPAPIRGSIHWRADDTASPPGPIHPIPATLWQPPAASTPATGSYIYLQSHQGDPVGRGRTYLFAGDAHGIDVITQENGAAVFGGDSHGDIAFMSSSSRLELGLYSFLGRFPFHNPAKGGMNWTFQLVGCSGLSGWYAVDRVTYANGVITALELRFEQWCDEGTGALRGKVRWSA